MAWTDKPTDSQLRAIFRFLDFDTLVPTAKVHAAVDWLEEHANRREASDEMRRLRSLSLKKKLNKTNCFESRVWEGFEFDEDTIPSEEQLALVRTILKDYFTSVQTIILSTWLKTHVTREAVSAEIDRLKELGKEHKLDGDIFEAPIWADLPEALKGDKNV